MDLELIKKIRVLGTSIKVLLVEDEEPIRTQILKTLSKLFEEVDFASNGAESLELYAQKKHDLILTDLKMPVMDGLELCKNIKSINKEQDIILVSAYSESKELLELMNIGVSSFILKPVDINLLLDKLCISSKNIYSRKMMRYHYEQMEQQLLSCAKVSEEEKLSIDTPASLYNNKYFLKIVNDVKSTQSAILININDFELINNYYSYAHGNNLLLQVSQVIKEKSLELGYALFNISIGKFILLREYMSQDCESMLRDAIYLQEALERKKYSIIDIDNIAINTTIAIAKSEGRLLESLNCTLYYAKNNGLKYALYSDIPDIVLDMKNIIEVKNMLQDSIENSNVIPVYQPIFMRDGSIKYEMLMRIRDPYSPNTLIAPSVFLDIAQKYNYYNEMSEMLMFKGIEHLSQNDKTISINFSYSDISNSKLLDKLEKNIIEKSIAHRLVFEIVETEHLDNMQVVKMFIERFRAIGIKIAIDDFGSGYSNFAYIYTLEPDFIKIDGSLISEVLIDERIAVLVSTIIELSHKFGIKVIAEYISSKELADKLMLMGADGLQGFFIGFPEENLDRFDI